jgi:NAD-dependent deacetylase
MTPDSLIQARKILHESSRVAAFSGAGLSAESGISTFRDKQKGGLWSRFDPSELASVQGFLANPERVIEWYNWRRRILVNAEPNPGHQALAGQTHLIQITQNVDDFLERAGVPEHRIYHLHGTITRDRCHSGFCGYEEPIDLAEPPPLRACPNCGHRLRPAVVWFGESLPQRTWNDAMSLCTRIDCLLVIGTSASVYPAAGLIQLAKQHASRIIIINTQTSDASDLADIELIGPSGTILPELLDGIKLRSQ